MAKKSTKKVVKLNIERLEKRIAPTRAAIAMG